MRRDPSLTYQGALNILGRYDRPRLEKLDRLLGGIILGGGVAAATGIAPLAGLAAVWGWVDQKNAATALVRKLLDSARDRLSGTAGYERHQLIAAAHTTLVGAAFFEALEEQVGSATFERLAITDDERGALVLDRWREQGEGFIADLYEAEVPAPSPLRGFEENVLLVSEWMLRLIARTEYFLSGLAAWEETGHRLKAQLIYDAVGRYRSHFLRMAATVPEFLVWASLGEHAATRDLVGEVRADLMTVLTKQGAALSRLETLLETAIAPTPRRGRDRAGCDVVRRANRGALDESILSPEARRANLDLTFPTLREAFVNPRYRLGAQTSGARVADESWWADRPAAGDIDMLLAAHMTAPDAMRLPMLLLGHPGAGKSCLTKMVAARLPASGYTVVRVPLRRVDAEAPVYDQIQQALDRATHRRVDWTELAEQSAETIRVVLLDGLDELLQAAGDRAGYLQEVADFQRREAEQDRPVVVVVTSRTVVADRVRIPDGTTVVKLEDFDEDQIAAWCQVWNHANAAAIEAGRVRALTPAAAATQAELARQPLLLLMLALYCADPSLPSLESHVSKAALYRRLLETFTHREVAKTHEGSRADVIDEAVQEQLWRLTVAAFAMCNRGRQEVTDAELGSDLTALDDGPPGGVRAAELGQRVIGQFFFVHAAEARTHDARAGRNAYEFMHATFGEYLIAAQVIEMLVEAASAAASGRRRGPREPSDELIFALLSHQPVALTLQVLIFVRELLDELSVEERGPVMRTLEKLVATCRQRYDSGRYAAYRPLPVDHVRQLAVYSANLVLLRVWCASGGVPLDRFWPDTDRPIVRWRSTVALWSSGLDGAGWRAMLDVLDFSKGAIFSAAGSDLPLLSLPIRRARLIDDEILNAHLLIGSEVYRHVRGWDEAGDWAPDEWGLEMFASLLAATVAGSPRSSHIRLVPPPKGTPRRRVIEVFDMLATVLKTRAEHVPSKDAIAVARWVLTHCVPYRFFDAHALAALVAAHTWLLVELPELRDPALYRNAKGAAPLLRMVTAPSGELPEAVEMDLVEEDPDVRLRELCHRIEAEQVWTDDGDPLLAAPAVLDGYKHPGSVGSLELIPVEPDDAHVDPAPSTDSARHMHQSDGTAVESPRE